ncbi:MAG: hypothetical protein ACYCVL_07535, partial [Gemmatimonadaceae bacterium]
MMKIRILVVAALLCATPIGAVAQNAPACASRLDVSGEVEHIFDTFVNPNAAQIRADYGIQTQADSAPRGVLKDNAACALLRVATLALLEAQGPPPVPQNIDMSFLRLGDYVGVFVNWPPPDSTGVVASGW